MHLTRPLSPLRRRTRRGAAARQEASPGRERNKRANVSEDAALYSCQCGYVFKAAVTTSVGCPHCGSAQAW
jgi:rubrerythrin